MTLVSRIADYVRQTTLDDFDQSVVERAKGLCLSALGSMVLGSRMEVAQAMADYARALGGTPQASAIGFGMRTSTDMAAALNCISSHCTEYEDVAWPEAQYTCFLLPAAFTLGEALKASGRAVLEAVILGFEVAARPSMTTSDHGAAKRGFLSCANIGTMGAAAAAAKMMGLDADAMRDAIALAPSLGGGLVRQTGSAAHVVEAGFAARDGIMAAELARRGIGGNPTILDGPAGYFDALAGQPDIRFELGTGKDLRVMHVGQKKYPCCYLLQRIIDGLRELVSANGIGIENIARVEVEVNEAFQNIVKYDAPLDVEQARFSLPFTVAAVLAGEAMDWRTFSVEGLANPEIVKHLDRVGAVVIPGSGFEQLSKSNRIVVHLKDGSSVAITCTVAHGDAVDPLSVEENAQGFREKTSGLLSQEAIEEVIHLVGRLEFLEDVTPLVRCLEPGLAA
ncbi:MmgE/PrpD family protein [Sphingobium sp.]|uniref:MmgE/PrpD family protein n=1 Tax=Sphingobium sp. TaxID=1912891 RepID=UPI0028BDE0C0|nr:MmgE/PrpD family protein [Sphingobium sp.]